MAISLGIYHIFRQTHIFIGLSYNFRYSYIETHLFMDIWYISQQHLKSSNEVQLHIVVAIAKNSRKKVALCHGCHQDERTWISAMVAPWKRVNSNSTCFQWSMYINVPYFFGLNLEKMEYDDAIVSVYLKEQHHKETWWFNGLDEHSLSSPNSQNKGGKAYLHLFATHGVVLVKKE